jgi:hypothetical protein
LAEELLVFGQMELVAQVGLAVAALDIAELVALVLQDKVMLAVLGLI